MASQSNDQDNNDVDIEVSDEPRKATDVIISLERKFDLMIRVVSGTDINNKLILDRMNKMCSLLENLCNKIENSIETTEPKEKITEDIITSPPIEIENDPKGIRRISRPETYPTTQERESAGKVIPVMQKVLDNNGKMVFMAEVEILRNDDHSPAAKVRTTTGGKWQAPLALGDYLIYILKRENNGRKRMEYRGSFTVMESDKPIELPPVKLL